MDDITHPDSKLSRAMRAASSTITPCCKAVPYIRAMDAPETHSIIVRIECYACGSGVSNHLPKQHLMGLTEEALTVGLSYGVRALTKPHERVPRGGPDSSARDMRRGETGTLESGKVVLDKKDSDMLSPLSGGDGDSKTPTADSMAFPADRIVEAINALREVNEMLTENGMGSARLEDAAAGLEDELKKRNYPVPTRVEADDIPVTPEATQQPSSAGDFIETNGVMPLSVGSGSLKLGVGVLNPRSGIGINSQPDERLTAEQVEAARKYIEAYDKDKAERELAEVRDARMRVAHEKQELSTLEAYKQRVASWMRSRLEPTT